MQLWSCQWQSFIQVRRTREIIHFLLRLLFQVVSLCRVVLGLLRLLFFMPDTKKHLTFSLLTFVHPTTYNVKWKALVDFTVKLQTRRNIVYLIYIKIYNWLVKNSCQMIEKITTQFHNKVKYDAVTKSICSKNSN